MTNRPAALSWPLVVLLLLLVALGMFALVEGAQSASVLLLAAILLGQVLLRRARRCPACGRAGIPRQPTHGVFECAACGERFRRVRQGSAVWLDLERPRPDAEPAAPFARLRRSRLEHIPQPPSDRWAWIAAFLPRLRALRRQLRPLAGQPARVLNLMKPPPLEFDLTEPWGVAEPQAVTPTGPKRWRSIVARAALIMVSCAALLGMVPSLSRLYALDSAYYLIVLFAIGTCAVVIPALGQALKLSPTATLALLASDLVLKSLHLAAIGRVADLYVLATLAIAFPATPLLLGLLFRRSGVVEEPVGDLTTGQLLRNKQARERKNPGFSAVSSGGRTSH